MSQCPACAATAANPKSGAVQADCRACSIRELARGPLYFYAMQYRQALRALGGDEQQTHAEVRTAAQARHRPVA